MERVVFNYPKWTYSEDCRFPTDKLCLHFKNFSWGDQATLFSSNQCLSDRSIMYGAKCFLGSNCHQRYSVPKCRTAGSICSVDNFYVHEKELRTFEDALEQCELSDGHLCQFYIYDNIYID